jgi:hypothetical protein
MARGSHKLTADEWAREYYADSLPVAVSRQKTAEILRAALGLPNDAQPGLPEAIPLPTVEGDQVEFGPCLEALRDAAMQGHGVATLLALRACLVFAPDQPLPDWLRRIFATAIRGWFDHTWLTLDEALQAKYSRGKVDNAHFHAQLDSQMVLDVRHAQAEGVAIGRELFGEVGRHYNLSASAVERVWIAHRENFNPSKHDS